MLATKVQRLLLKRNLMMARSFGSQVRAIEEHSKHRMKLPLYDLEPRTENNWIAPSATVIGEV